jgi:hypothetical protein
MKKKEILFLGKTKPGRVHDKKLLDKNNFHENIPEEITKWMDTGFIGMNGNNIMMPKKKPIGRKLTQKEKEENRTISGIRIIVENAIGGVKRFGIVSNIFRNRISGMDDKVMLLACGLWNYHLRMES